MASTILHLKPGRDRAVFMRDMRNAGLSFRPVKAMPHIFIVDGVAPQDFPLRDHPAVEDFSDGDAQYHFAGAIAPESITISNADNFAGLRDGAWALARIIRRRAPWNVNRISHPVETFFRSNRNGEGVDIYIIDSGIRETHDEFDGNVVNVTLPIEDPPTYAHGTAVASCAIGATCGIARGALVWGFQAGDGSGISTADIITALGDAKSHYDSRSGTNRPAVVNISINGAANSTLQSAITTMVNAGMVVVSCVGNNLGSVESALSSSYPAQYGNVISVGGTGMADLPLNSGTFTTNWATWIDISAPSQHVRAAWGDPLLDSSYAAVNGTSFGSPFTAAVVACMLEGEPRLTNSTQVAAVKTALRDAATIGRIRTAWGLTLPDRMLYLDPGEAEIPLSAPVIAATASAPGQITVSEVTPPQEHDVVALYGSDSAISDTLARELLKHWSSIEPDWGTWIWDDSGGPTTVVASGGLLEVDVPASSGEYHGGGIFSTSESKPDLTGKGVSAFIPLALAGSMDTTTDFLIRDDGLEDHEGVGFLIANGNIHYLKVTEGVYTYPETPVAYNPAVHRHFLIWHNSTLDQFELYVSDTGLPDSWTLLFTEERWFSGITGPTIHFWAQTWEDGFVGGMAQLGDVLLWDSLDAPGELLDADWDGSDYDDSGLGFEHERFYRAFAFRGSEYESSNQATATTDEDPTPPGPTPAVIAAATTGVGQITVSEVSAPVGDDSTDLWAAASAGDLGEGGPTGSATLLEADWDGSDVVESGIADSTTRHYAAYSTNGDGTNRSNVANATTGVNPAPVISAANTGEGENTITIVTPSAGASNHKIYVAGDPAHLSLTDIEPFLLDGALGAAPAPYVHSGLGYGVIRYYRVAGVVGGVDYRSNIVSATTPPPPPPEAGEVGMRFYRRLNWYGMMHVGAVFTVAGPEEGEHDGTRWMLSNYFGAPDAAPEDLTPTEIELVDETGTTVLEIDSLGFNSQVSWMGKYSLAFSFRINGEWTQYTAPVHFTTLAFPPTIEVSIPEPGKVRFRGENWGTQNPHKLYAMLTPAEGFQGTTRNWAWGSPPTFEQLGTVIWEGDLPTDDIYFDVTFDFPDGETYCYLLAGVDENEHLAGHHWDAEFGEP